MLLKVAVDECSDCGIHFPITRGTDMSVLIYSTADGRLSQRRRHLQDSSLSE